MYSANEKSGEQGIPGIRERRDPAGRIGVTTRRGFLQGAVLLAGAAGAAALAGCGGGGGGDNSPWDIFSGTYRGITNDSSGDQVAASVSVDSDGIATFFTLLLNVASPFADYGQVALDSSGNFSQSIGGITTYGQVRGGSARGRTQYTSDPSTGYDWSTSRYSPGGSHPGDSEIGTFEGLTQLAGINYTTLLTVAPDGSFTFFGAFDNPSTNGLDYFVGDSAHFDRNGNVPNQNDYFLFLYGDQMDLRSSGTDAVRLEFTFGQDASAIGITAGDRVDFVLSRVVSRSAVASSRAAAQRRSIPDARAAMAADAPALRRAIAAIRHR